MRSQRVLEWNCICLVILGKGQSSLRKGCSVFILMVSVLVLAVWKSILGPVIRPWVGRISVRSVGLSFLRVNWKEENSNVERFHAVCSWDLVFLKTMVSKMLAKKKRRFIKGAPLSIIWTYVCLKSAFSEAFEACLSAAAIFWWEHHAHWRKRKCFGKWNQKHFYTSVIHNGRPIDHYVKVINYLVLILHFNFH